MTRPKIAALLLACVVLGPAAFFGWRGYRLPERVQAGLPAWPDLTGKPAVQGDLLARATALTRSRSTALAGVIELGRLYHANGYRAEAEACWRVLHREQPREARWTHALADLRRTAGDSAAYSAWLTQTVTLAPDYSPAWLQLAGLAFKAGQLDPAERHYRRRLVLVPGDPHAQLGLVRVAQASGSADEARRLLEQVVRDDPKFSPGQNLYAELLAAAGDAAGARQHRWLGREAGRFREAEDPWLDELHAWCHDFDGLCLLATVAFQTDQADRAKSLLERAVRLAPDHPVGYELLGSLYRKTGDAARARDTLEAGLRAARAVQPSPSFYVALGETYGDLRQPVEALRIADMGLAQGGEPLELHDARGLALAALDRHDEAIAAFRVVLARLPNDANSHYNLGLSLLARGQPAEAQAAFKRCLIQQPTSLKALSVLGRWELQAGRLAAAGEYLQPLYESHPGVPAVRQVLASWHLASGALAEKKNSGAAAEHHYRAGAAVMPDHAELQVSLGILLLAQGRIADARLPLEAYARLQPANPQSALFLGQVYLQLGRRDDARRILAAGEQLARRAGQTTTVGYFQEMLQGL
jgi:HemY protein